MGDRVDTVLVFLCNHCSSVHTWNPARPLLRVCRVCRRPGLTGFLVVDWDKKVRELLSSAPAFVRAANAH